MYLPHGHGSPMMGRYAGQMELDDIRRIITPLLEDKRFEWVLHNAPFDAAMCRKDGVILPWDRLHCTSVAARVISWGTGRWDPRSPDHGEASPRSLENLTHEFCGWQVRSLEGMDTYWQRDPFARETYEYAAADASNALAIFPYMMKLLDQFSLVGAYTVERGCMVPVQVMRSRGVVLDEELCRAKAKEGAEIARRLGDEYLAELSKALGRTVTSADLKLSSAPQVQKLLFEPRPEGLGLPVKAVSKKTGKPSAGKKVLEQLAREFPIVRGLMDYRKISKNLDGFLDSLPDHVRPDTGRIHSNFNPLATATGRFSSSKPNLQQLPKRGIEFKLGGKAYKSNVRDLIIAGEGFYLLDADYSQIEYRAMAGEANEQSLVEAFNRGEDVHRRTAALIYGMPYEDVTEPVRDGGKTMNFALLYGRGVAAIAEALGITEEAAAELHRNYFDRLPAIRQWRERTAAEAQRAGYAVTRFGRRRFIEEFLSPISGVRAKGQREAVNMVIQGVCADIMKIAIARVWRGILERGWYGKVWPILTVHDSLGLEVDESIALHDAVALQREAMCITVQGWPVIEVDQKAGFRYGSLREVTVDTCESFEWPERAVTSAPPERVEDDVLDPAEEEEQLTFPDSEPTDVDVLPERVVIEIPAMTAGQSAAFKALVQSNPGPHPVSVVVAGRRKDLNATVSLSAESLAWVEALGPVVVKAESSAVLSEVSFV
jgi:DNA polymerase-1